MGGRFRAWLLVAVTMVTVAAHRYSRRRLLGGLAAGLVPVAVAAGLWAGLGRSSVARPAGHPEALLSTSTPGGAQGAPSSSATPAPSPSSALLPAPSGSAPAPAGSPYTAATATHPGHSGPAIVGRLLVSAIHINMPVEAVGTNAHGEMGIPVNPNDAGWWQPGYAPGEAGHAVVDGHVNWYTGPGPFRDLHKLHQGDLVTLSWGNGRTYTYSVTSLTTYAWNAAVPGAFGPAAQPTLTMITCAGTWDAAHQRYTARLIVQAQISSTA